MGIRCKLFGHKWAGIGPLEHICVKDWCWWCYEKRIVHNIGPWPHTCVAFGLYDHPDEI
jgi:hypothetical protein